eukprot:TRINITY_DN10443_c3_g1_i1.p1 TRINITY_DN10443_c3_g1~~TRINITY_DN10443_c3_g1_i1.p1  ORF type:complete len:277 (+),score=41.26 TRINITY_DN10443_c3_g1_i1:93-923(+)
MELSNAIISTMGKMCLEKPSKQGKPYGGALLESLGMRVAIFENERNSTYIFKEPTMEDAAYWFKKATGTGTSTANRNTILQCVKRLQEDTLKGLPGVKGVRCRLQAYAMLMLSTYYINSDFGETKESGVLASVRIFHEVTHDEKVMKNLQVHLSCKVFLTENQNELCSSYYDLHSEIIYATAILIVMLATASNTRQLTQNETGNLSSLITCFTDAADLMKRQYAPTAFLSISKFREKICIETVKPPQHRIDLIRACFAYVSRATGYCSTTMHYCIQ